MQRNEQQLQHTCRQQNQSSVDESIGCCVDVSWLGPGINAALRELYIRGEIKDLRVQTWESVHFRLMYQEKLIQGSRLRRPPEANDIAGVYAVISGGEKNIRKIEKAIKIFYCACAQVEIGVPRKSSGVYCENVYETLRFVLAVSLSKARHVRAGPIEQALSFASGSF